MKLLYLAARPPYPPHKGDQLIAWEQIKQLKKRNYRIYFISFISSSEEEELIIRKLSPYCEKIHLLKLTKRTMFTNLFKTLINFKPLQVNMYINRKMKHSVSNLFSEIQPDIAHIQTLRVAEYFMEREIPKTVDMIDALSLNMFRRSRKEKVYKKIILLLEHSLLKRYEHHVLNAYNQTFIISENDKRYLKSDTIEVNPNGTYITPQYLAKYPTYNKEKIILFHGNMQYYPNIEAAYNFATKVWPEIHEEYPDYQFYIVGKDPVKKIKQLNGRDNVVVTGFVEDICEILCKSLIGVYPMMSGTGMQNKVIEALSCGLPVIASTLALQGISDINDDEVIKYTTNEELKIHLKKLMTSKELRDRLSANGQRFLNANYSWESNCEKLVTTWKNIV
ncbi:glycosyltransferase family 4 protein [Rossellomorea sp. BNER]|uniref:glycosyltransferase family 4 protein n=1 Tax=Rossellomorea sp. BNER TaxID=2962031 RepID=UPI003AF2CBAE|nr:glycosyltransferase family 4 protein [Rossellomorea sp. BNER]